MTAHRGAPPAIPTLREQAVSGPLPGGRSNQAVLHPPGRPVVAIVGAGRAGTALGRALHAAGYRISAVHSLSDASAARLAAEVGAIPVATAVAAVRRADLTLLTVPDRAITRIGATVAASGMALRDHAIVHCSGAQGRGALAAARHGGAAVGSCHPLTALTRSARPDELHGTFFGLDADARLRPMLDRLVLDLGGTPFTAPAGDRALYHAAAVLAGNAPLALLARATELLMSAGVSQEVAGPALAGLLEGAARNARRLGTQAALTGPVVRNDAATVAAHLEALRYDPAGQRLYLRLARETLRAAGATGREEVATVLAGTTRGGRPSRSGAVPDAAPGRAALRRAPAA